MNGHLPFQPVKSQAIDVTVGKRTYRVCSEGQYDFILMAAREEIIQKAAMEQKSLTDDEINKEIEAYKETCPYATIAILFSKMSPSERQRWQDNYRFSGIYRSTANDS